MKKTLGTTICLLRKHKGISQEELADQLGVSRQTVSKWERDTVSPNADNITIMASIFDVNTDTLLNCDVQLLYTDVASALAEKPSRKRRKGSKAGFVISMVFLSVLFMLSMVATIVLGLLIYVVNTGDELCKSENIDPVFFFITLFVVVATAFIQAILILKRIKNKGE